LVLSPARMPAVNWRRRICGHSHFVRADRIIELIRRSAKADEHMWNEGHRMPLPDLVGQARKAGVEMAPFVSTVSTRLLISRRPRPASRRGDVFLREVRRIAGECYKGPLKGIREPGPPAQRT
jgi:hypothetical protein